MGDSGSPLGCRSPLTPEKLVHELPRWLEFILNSSHESSHATEDYVGWIITTVDGNTIGPVTGILPGIANDNLIVQGTQGEILIPVIDDVIVAANTATGTIVIEPMEGLLDLNARKPKS